MTTATSAEGGARNHAGDIDPRFAVRDSQFAVRSSPFAVRRSWFAVRDP
jgi:hypothetical protein